MKKFLCMLLCLCFLPLVALSEDDAESEAARELMIEATDGKNQLDMDALRDRVDDTAATFKRGKSLTIAAEIPEEETCGQIYLRMDTAPESITLRTKENKRWVDAETFSDPGAECVLDVQVTGAIQLVVNFSSAVSVSVSELRFFTDGTLPSSLHAWQRDAQADLLLVAETPAQLDTDKIAAWVTEGRSVACLLMTSDESTSLLSLYDTLWDAGVRRTPTLLNLTAQTEGTEEKKLDKAWTDKFFLYPLVSAIRSAEPMVVLSAATNGREDYLLQKVTTAAADAQESTFQTADAEENGIWVVPHVYAVDDTALADTLSAWEERSDRYLRALCWRQYDGAVHSDPSTIPYPDNRLEDGYLAEGEFVYEDADNGLWAYLSSTIQIEIVRYELPEKPQVWFVTDLKFKPESESFAQVLYANASFKGQQIYPETLAQTSKLVLGVNGDYYPYRVDRKTGVGNILRNREVLYNYDAKKRMAYPNLDTMALRDDGTLSVYAGSEISATELLAEGDVHDALSFGPYLARDGKIRIYSGEGYDATEPRNAIGMIEAGHYCIITVEGRINPGPKGVTLNVLAEMMYAQGVTDAFNLDGGSTSVLIFMGTKLNRTGANSGHGVGSPRNMHELFGVGTSDLVHTDAVNKK